ncbi:MAG TPA: DegV family protein [Ktedonobacterales bacterium]|nr:DegV family protein [Ktedonobacterales bacterium]
MTVRVLVDSTADIPPERARELGIEVAPLTVHFGDETFHDGVDLDGPGFYRRLTTSPVMPTTSTPPPGLFEDIYRKLLAQGATGVLAMHIGSDLSATYSVSTTAARTVTAETGMPIEVIDSRQVSAGYGLPAEVVAAEAKEGASLPDLKAHAESLLSRTHLVAVLDTLEFLQRGGRIGRGAAFLGTVMNVKPLLEVRDSAVHPLERVRTTAKARERVGQIVAQLGELEAVAIVQSDDNTGQQLLSVARQFWNGPAEIFSLGPVVGTHAGPGAGAIVAITRK